MGMGLWLAACSALEPLPAPPDAVPAVDVGPFDLGRKLDAGEPDLARADLGRFDFGGVDAAPMDTGDPCPGGCDDGRPCTEDECTPDGCRHTPIVPCLGCARPLDRPPTTSTSATGDIEGRTGQLPIILAAPHGGFVRPESIPDRSFGVVARDTLSRHVTYEVSHHLSRLTGREPYLIINRLHRIKLDANREIVEAAQANPRAEDAWEDFHRRIDAAKAEVAERCGAGLFIDMHTHVHEEGWTEMGFLLRGSELEQDDRALDALLSRTSVKDLVGRSGRPLAEVVRGPSSLGTLLGRDGFFTVPSRDQPDPDGGGYFSGGYNTARHGSRDEGVIDGIQVENALVLLDVNDRAERYARSLAEAIVDFYDGFNGTHLRDPSWTPPPAERCAATGPAHDLSAGPLRVRGTTAGASDEHGPAVTCGSGFFLDGPQIYHPVLVEAGQSYTLRVTPTFGARIYTFQSGCSAAEIQASCANGDVQGNLISAYGTETFTLRPTRSGVLTVAVDSRARTWFGAYALSVERD